MLHDLFLQLFSKNELRMFLEDFVERRGERGEGARFCAHLNCDTDAVFCSSAAENLRQRGLVDGSLFQALRQQRPHQKALIDPVEKALISPAYGRITLHISILRQGTGARWRWSTRPDHCLQGALAQLPRDPLDCLRGPKTWPELLVWATGRPMTGPDGVSLRVLLHSDHPHILSLDLSRLWYLGQDLSRLGQWSIEWAGREFPTHRLCLEPPFAIDLVGKAPALRDSLATLLTEAWPSARWDDVRERTAEQVKTEEVNGLRCPRAPIRVVLGEQPDLPPVQLEVRLSGRSVGDEMSSVVQAHLDPQRAGRPERARQAALDWLREVLCRGKSPGPAWYELGFGPATSRYLDFQLGRSSPRPRRENIRRRLDRFRWRTTAEGHIRLLANDYSRRVLLLTGSGEPGNLVQALYQQIEDWALRSSQDYQLVVVPNVELPKQTTAAAFHEEFLAAQQLQADLPTWLALQCSRSARPVAVVVLCLDVATTANPIDATKLRLLAEWGRDFLRPALEDSRVPQGARALIWLAAEV
ncbi:MAG TPA: hypothetical protein PKW90_12260, partial [Myxococcota bacterium]|nr:hypothetical protein [Myxococcota bacterium]